MPTRMMLQVGTTHLAVDAAHLPPVGTVLQVHKHLTDDGQSTNVRVESHEWVLDEPAEEGELPAFTLWIKTTVWHPPKIARMSPDYTDQ